jgi:CubicO group peptidase (beta-lactamase class C family)
MKKMILYMLVFVTTSITLTAQTLYFPPNSQTAQWDSLSPNSLNWCQANIDSMYDFLQQENTKGFMVLKNGKIVLEKYFGTFQQDSSWYWASASKSLLGFMVGQAQEQSLLSIQDSSSKLLGTGWSVCTPTQESQIKIVHHLSMSTGLNDYVLDKNCIIDTCLQYLTPVNTRWAYHNAPYRLLQNAIENSSLLSLNAFTTQNLKDRIGMSGTWLGSSGESIFYSKLRSMSRFGLLMQNNGIWNIDTLLKDNVYKTAMLSTSQNKNLSYGYLWWLNGKASHMLPGYQIVIPTSICSQAPNDMFAALGKNGQILSICPSQGLVIARMGENPSASTSMDVPTQLLINIWMHINALECLPASVSKAEKFSFKITNNPVINRLNFTISNSATFKVIITNIIGNKMLEVDNRTSIDVANFPSGMYILNIVQNGKSHVQKFNKQ